MNPTNRPANCPTRALLNWQQLRERARKTSEKKATTVLDEAKKSRVLEQVAHIIDSEFFRGSQRCRQFLEYSVNYVLDERPLNELKERTIGIEVFRKPNNYDTAQDNTVRVTANEVRKRLAQYYGENDHKTSPVIQLPSGSYAVSLLWRVEEDTAPSVPSTPSEANQRTATAQPRTFNWKFAAIGATALALLILAGVALYQRNTDVVGRVWAPFLNNPKPLIICMGEPVVYRPKSNHDEPLSADDTMVPLPGQLIGTGDAYALVDLAKYLSPHRKDWTLLTRSSTTSENLFNNPSVLIGAYSNPWTLALTTHLRFYFGANNTIYDRNKPERHWQVAMSADWKTEHDYAVVSRFISPSTGQPIIIVAGIYSYGTRVAAEFVLNPNLLTEALSEAPPDWEHKNFQFVLHTKIIGNTPSRPQVVAAYFW